MRHEKLTGVSVSYSFRTDHYIVVMETSGAKYGAKNTKENNIDCKSYGTIDFKFQDCYWIELIVFFISQFYA